MLLEAEIATLNTKIQQLQREANNEDLTRDVAKGRSEIVRLKGEIVDLESKFRCWYHYKCSSRAKLSTGGFANFPI